MKPRLGCKSPNWRNTGMLFILFAIALVWWNSWPLYPVKLLVVFFHELSHAIAAWVTGGRVVEIRLKPNLGGLCITQGGNRFLTLTAGYLGSILCGGFILAAGARARRPEPATFALAAILGGATLFLVRPIAGFGFLFCAAASVAFAAVAARANTWVNRLLLQFTGLCSCLYPIVDIKSDILDRPQACSDALMLAKHTHIPTVIWGALWIVLAVIIALRFILFAARLNN